MSISVVMISLTPISDRATAGPNDHSAPPAAAAISMSTISMGPGASGSSRPTRVAATAPNMICPSAPMFQRPIVAAIETARPASASGTARLNVSLQVLREPSERSHMRS